MLQGGSSETVEGGEPSEEPMDTEVEASGPDSPDRNRIQPNQEEEVEEDEEEEEVEEEVEAAAASKMEHEQRFSPQLSEEEALDEGHVTVEPEPSEIHLSFANESKHSPSPVEVELLDRTSLPVEAYGSASQLEGGAVGEEDLGPASPSPRPHHLVKSDIVNEISNLSQGDASASSFPGSELPFASPYHEGGGSLSLEMAGLTSTDVSLQREDGASLPLGEMEDSLLFDVKGECEKGRRRSSPARSRVKQVTGGLQPANFECCLLSLSYSVENPLPHLHVRGVLEEGW